MNVTLEAVTIDNFEALMDMALPPEQAGYLASNAYSIAQAHYYLELEKDRAGEQIEREVHPLA